MASKRILLAAPRGFCAGVRHAVDIVETALKRYPTPIYCLKELVHNTQVVDGLTQRGVCFVQDIAVVPRGACVLFSAHGVTPAIRREARQRGLQILDATCPYVSRLHTAVRRYVREGCHVLLVGDRRHDEIIGVRGEAPEQVLVIGSQAEALAIKVPDPERVAAVTQTTLDVDEAQRILTLLRARFPALRVAARSGICFATENRQKAAREIAACADRVLVLGSPSSSNTKRLAQICRQHGGCAERISTLTDLEGLDWEAIDTIGLTAGASTPDAFVKDVIDHLRKLGFTNIEEHVAVEENVHFPLPRVLRVKA